MTVCFNNSPNSSRHIFTNAIINMVWNTISSLRAPQLIREHVVSTEQNSLPLKLSFSRWKTWASSAAPSPPGPHLSIWFLKLMVIGVHVATTGD
ncbi:hypothetical protein PoB_005321200 [Plakobranchus ocellatus]|uniref:Uncharacterized protein n=1 Tax=Plakobranchus ocellatus TaxID=259542 RepID=A0AAV4C5Q3_9GAST|nr:hypothetical protein PoB_005321200 [Plakobranchus ocellatus]